MECSNRVDPTLLLPAGEFERADSVLFGMPESNAELASAFLAM
jgi:hypothetical protein